MGDFSVSNNMIGSGDDGIRFDDYNVLYIGYDMNDNASMTMGNIEFENNVIGTGGTGIWINCSGFGDDRNDDSTFTMDEFLIKGNFIEIAWTGLYLYGVNESIIQDNVVDGCPYGAVLINSSNNTVYRNLIRDAMEYGITLTNSTNNTIYYNDFLYNVVQAFDNMNTSAWNYTYPTGGNYWSDYTGDDDYSGPGQNLSGSDGIGDTPYNITGNTTPNMDHYPLMAQVNLPPYAPRDPSPTNGSTIVGVTPVLSWTGGDPNDDPVTYDVYFGTSSSPPKVANKQSPTTYTPGTLSAHTVYYWKIVAFDNPGLLSTAGPIWSFTTGTGEVPPSPPTNPQSDHFLPTADAGGPYYGLVDSAVTFDGSGSHANKQNYTIIKYEWRFFNNDTWHDLGAHPTHTYTSPGTYAVTLRVYDNDYYKGVDSTTATISPPGNAAPSTPVISGPATGDSLVSYDYSFTSTDPNNDDVQYFIDWGDATTTASTLLTSGVAYDASHAWASNGVYNISVYAKDAYGASSGTAKKVMVIGGVSVTGGSLVDLNGDGVFDVYYNSTTGRTTHVSLQADGTYLIDVNGDGIWDYVYDPVNGTFSPYSPSIFGGANALLWGIGLVIIAIIVIAGVVLVLMRRKKK